MIEVENLTKTYGNHKAIDGLSFKVEKGQIFGFLGPNGAGKSTTMNIMTGYIASSGGTVKIDGHDILKEPAKAKKCIGYLPEIPPVYPDMTVKEYLDFVAELKKVPKTVRKEQIQEIMDKTRVIDVENRLIKNLSKGYKQRVGLAQAIVGYPDVIILDEPTVGLDPLQIIEIRELIKELAKEHTIILSSHILSEVSAICDHIMIISKGKLVALDTPENLGKLMESNGKLELEVLGTKEKLDAILSGYEMIKEREVTQMEDVVKASITMDGKADIRKELFFDLAREEMPIMRLEHIDKSLETIFLELTSDSYVKETKKQEDMSDDSNL